MNSYKFLAVPTKIYIKNISLFIYLTLVNVTPSVYVVSVIVNQKPCETT